MCVSCGCGKYEEDHGDDRNITMKDLNAAASAGGVSFEDVFRNIQEASRQGANQRGGQTS